MKHSKATKRSWQRDEYSIQSLKEYFGDLYMSKINAGHIEKYKTKRIGQVSPATCNRELACLSAIFTMAKKSKLVESNPVTEVKKFQERKLQMQILSKEDAESLIEAASEPLRAILTIVLNTGMRRGEILNLRWADIDFDLHVISLWNTKGGKTRKIPMNAYVEETLNRIKRIESDYVFTSKRTGKPLCDVRKPFFEACDKAKIKGLRFHDLRHTSATWMVMAGIDLVTVSEILGHSDIKMTLRYAHPTPQNRRRAVEALAAVFGRKSNEVDTYRTPRPEGLPATPSVSTN